MRLSVVSRCVLASLLCGFMGACSSDTVRLSQNPFSNPMGSSEPVATGAVAEPNAYKPQPRSRVESQPLSAPTTSVSASNSGVFSSSRGTVSSQQGGWSAEGGTPITVGQGESLGTLSSRYGVPSAAILSANRLNAAQVTTGARVIIPVYNAAGKSADAGKNLSEAYPAPKTAEAIIPVSRPHESRQAVLKNPSEKTADASASKAVKNAEKSVSAQSEAAKSEPVKPETLKVAAKPEDVKAPVVKEAKSKPAAESKQVASIEPTKPHAAQPERVAEKPQEPERTASLPSSPSSNADFRWPARGRVITGFGNGNEGINIAVPEGTPVKSAEAGTVAYAGSELKGYGNLVLIRHDNGYVSAYANNGELAVKRGDKVKRGQLVAKSGQSGNVNSPQLHFEIRKGSTPVDPVPYLAN